MYVDKVPPGWIGFAQSGTVNITGYSNNLVSGNFSINVTGSTGCVSVLTGSFANIKVVP